VTTAPSAVHLVGLALLAATACAEPPASETPTLDALKLPPGFRITVFSDATPGARSLARGANGTVFVGTKSDGKVYGLVDADSDGRAETAYVIARDLDGANGIAFRDGDLYVAEHERLLRFDEIETRLADPPEPVVVFDGFPAEKHHGWRYLGFGPDGLLYVGIGAPCNVCERDDPIFATVARMRVDGSKPEVYASGVRNTVGFDWHPETGELWFTDNGRDHLGDDRPPDELNVATAAGQHFGFPFCHGGDLADPKFDERPCSDFRAPARKLGPHVAALGMRFYTATAFPPPYRGAVFIAEHGSWNRSTPIGYRVTVVRFEDGKPVSYEPFVEGWLADGDAWGRPVDVLVMPDGALLVSDDGAGVVYRITYGG